MTNEDIIQRRLDLLKDSGWRAALTIFTGELLSDREEVWAHIDLESQTIRIAEMLEDIGPMSGGEKRMVRLALSLFHDGHDVNLWRTLAGLDEENAELAADSVRIFHLSGIDIPVKRRVAIHEALVRRPIRERRQA